MINMKHDKKRSLLISTASLLLVCQFAFAQSIDFAPLDEKSSVLVGETVTIKSQFEGLPVVEPHISAHPRDNNHLLVAGMIVTDVNRPYQSCRLSSFVSSDGGQNWKETAHDWWGYDPWTAILPDGNTVMTWLGTKGSFQSQFPLQFFSSDNGGISWNDQVQGFQGKGHGHDGTKVTALKNEFYYTTVRFNGDMGADVVLYRKEGNGAFEEVAFVDGKGVRLNFCEPAILTDGTVIVPSSHFMTKLWIQTYNHKEKRLGEKNLVTSRPGGAGGYMRMLADVHSTSKFKDRIYFIRALGRGEEHEGIWINYSDDKGVSWSRDTRIDLFDNELPPRSLVPSIAVNEDGVVGISWVDSQHDPSQELKDVYFTLSLDGGLSFQKPTRVTKRSTNPKTEANADVARRFSGGGHYLGIDDKPDGSFQLIWSDSRSGFFELQTCNIRFDKN